MELKEELQKYRSAVNESPKLTGGNSFDGGFGPTEETSLDRYPEFAPVVDEIVAKVCREINKQAKTIQSKMPYKAQFILEEVIKELKERV